MKQADETILFHRIFYTEMAVLALLTYCFGWFALLYFLVPLVVVMVRLVAVRMTE